MEITGVGIGITPPFILYSAPVVEMAKISVFVHASKLCDTFEDFIVGICKRTELVNLSDLR